VGAWDARLHRLSVFSPGGDFVRARTIEPPTKEMFVRAEGVFADGSVLVAPDGSRVYGPETEVARDTIALMRYAAGGARVDTVGRFPGTQTFSTHGTDNGGWAARVAVPFGFDTFHAAHGDLLYLADNARREVSVHGPDGGLRRVLRAPYEPEALTPGEVEQYREAQLSAVSSAHPERPMLEQILAAMPFPKTKSAFAEMRVDRTGATWLREHSAGSDAPTQWTVFAEDGTLLGTVELPAGLRVVEIGADYVLGTWQDDLDVQHVRLHRLERTRGRA
jgi:hypothetical protein